MLRYFEKVGSGFNVTPAVEELQRLGVTGSDEGVGVVPLYQHPALMGIDVQNDHYGAAHALLREAVGALGGPEVYAAVLRVLPAKARIPKHQDGLTTAMRRRRYHLALQADDRSRFVIRDERCHFKSGELWRVDLLNRPHYVINDSDHARIMMMIDTLEGPLDEATIRKAHQQFAAAFGDDWQRLVNEFA